MENLTTTQIAQLIATARGEGGYKKLATKGAGIKQLGTLLTEKHGEEKANAAMEALDTADWETAQAIVAGLNGANAIAMEGANIPTTKTEGELPPAPVRPKKAKKQKGEGKGVGISGRRDQYLTIVPGPDPYRAGTLSAKTWDMMKANPGKTFREYLAMGARANTILDALRREMVTASSEAPKA